MDSLRRICSWPLHYRIDVQSYFVLKFALERNEVLVQRVLLGQDFQRPKHAFCFYIRPCQTRTCAFFVTKKNLCSHRINNRMPFGVQLSYSRSSYSMPTTTSLQGIPSCLQKVRAKKLCVQVAIESKSPWHAQPICH